MVVADQRVMFLKDILKIMNLLENSARESESLVKVFNVFSKWNAAYQNSVGLYSRVKIRGHDPRKLNTSQDR